MDLAFIQKLIDLHERSGMVELEYVQGDQRIRWSKAPITEVRASTQSAAPAGVRSVERSDVPCVEENDPPGGQAHVLATLSGIFHRRPSPSEPPYVNEGDQVQEGQMLGVVEAMKVLNGIESERAGRVVAVLAEDGASVEPGTVLFRIEPTPCDHV